MFKVLKQTLVALSVSLLLALPGATLAMQPAYAATVNSAGKQAACDGIGLTGAKCNQDAASGIGGIIRTIVNLLSLVVGAVAVIMIIIAGFRYITAGGDSNNIASAKNTLIYALVGLLIAALAQFIVKFVLSQVS